MSKLKKSGTKSTKTVGPATKPEVIPESAGPGSKSIIRAIRVTREILDAAKAYKKVTGISFYRLGEESIAAVLIKEGYLKVAKFGAGA